MFTQVIDSWEALTNTRVISDADLAAARLDRHIKIDSDQNAFSPDIKITQSKLRHD